MYRIRECLESIFLHGEYADKVVQHLFRQHRNMGSADRRLVAEAVYEIVRWKRLYAFILRKDHDALEKEDFNAMVKIWLVLNRYPIPEWPELAKPDEHEISQRYGKAKGHRAVWLSVPDWMDALGMEELGLSLWEKEMTCQNIPAGVILRANRLINEVQILAKLLKEENIDAQPVPGYPDALMLVGRPNVFVTKAYKEGRFEVQDASSQLVAPFLQIAPGMSVIDACAGAGGKSLHLAALMQNKGRLIAMDIHDYKLEKLKVRAKRNKVHNLECRVIESTKTIKRLHGSADRLLIDAPCSGLGVLRRNPDDKWKLSPEKIEQLKLTQQQILQQYAPMLKAGGKMVYATCSILPSENQHQIDSFLQSDIGKGFVKEDEKIILASESGFDGFYMCRLRKER